MVAPLLVYGAYALMGAGSALGIISFGWDIYQNYQRMKENERYWSDYYDNTGISPLYPYRAGSYNDYIGSALTASQGVLNLYSANKRKWSHD